MKPDWKDAPAWAKFLAVDDNGFWYWYASKPVLQGYCWNTKDKFALACKSIPETSLEERPNE